MNKALLQQFTSTCFVDVELVGVARFLFTELTHSANYYIYYYSLITYQYQSITGSHVNGRCQTVAES